MSDLSKYNEDRFLLLEAGFIAINQADEDSAVKLFKACEILDPKNPLIQAGFGYLHFHKLELEAAITYFEKALALDPNNEMAKTMMGLSLSLLPNKVAEGEKILMESARSSSDKSIKSVANTSLDFVDAFVKKTPGPADVKRK
jgi:tetratricopeptide (TPR) repeat protein